MKISPGNNSEANCSNPNSLPTQIPDLLEFEFSLGSHVYVGIVDKSGSVSRAFFAA
ncbi:unnamed protein product [Schistosoma curassoni]|uniref:LNS2 domain-containing protein n=1 Tax=Schistosoma curassoni TaxID=6186 RepID=A0A183JIU4_9TREM|nr:unnamed protein product [Schistosoma curassoni]